MKLFVLLFLTLFSSAFCGLGFLDRTSAVQDLEDHRPIDDLRYFFNTLFNQFNLSEPEGIVNCFNDKSATLFFKSLYEFHQLLNDTYERNQWRLHFDYAKLAILFHSLEGVGKCVRKTDDYRNLLEALNLDDWDEKDLMLMKYIYYQARYASLLNDFKSVIKNLNEKDNKRAGIAYARVLSNINSTLHYRGVYFLAHQAWENGFNIRLDIKNPSDSLRCWNNETSGYYLEFFLKMSEAITNGTWRESYINLHYFWRDFGKDLMEKIPKSTFECLENSYDGQLITHTLGLNIYDGSFVKPMLDWVGNHRLNFYLFMKGMKDNFDRYNLNHAGGIYAHFLEKVAKYVHNRDVPIEEEAELDEVLF